MARLIFLALVAILCFGCSSPQKADNAFEPMPHSRLDDHVASLKYNLHHDEQVCKDDAPLETTEIINGKPSDEFKSNDGRTFQYIKAMAGFMWFNHFCEKESVKYIPSTPGTLGSVTGNCCRTRYVEYATKVDASSK